MRNKKAVLFFEAFSQHRYAGPLYWVMGGVSYVSSSSKKMFNWLLGAIALGWLFNYGAEA
jgi:hypothetical protein